MTIEYRDNQPLDPVEVVHVFEASGIARPTKDIPRIMQMFSNANVVISAWDGTRLIGVSRGLTDFSYCCYPKLGFTLTDNAIFIQRKC
ncbi:MAG: hypothetical protein ABIG70_05155 [Pseudomonadota bacterium]